MDLRQTGVLGTRLELEKIRPGIKGLDEILGGGLPRGRLTLVCGSAGWRQEPDGG